MPLEHHMQNFSSIEKAPTWALCRRTNLCTHAPVQALQSTMAERGGGWRLAQVARQTASDDVGRYFPDLDGVLFLNSLQMQVYTLHLQRMYIYKDMENKTV